MSMFKSSEKASEKAGGFATLEPGKYDAVLHGIIELGVQTKKGYQGAPDKNVPMLQFLFEIPSVQSDDGVTKLVSKKVPYSLHEKSGLSAVVRALIQSSDQDKVVETVHSKEGIEGLIGRAISVTVDDWTPPDANFPVSVIRELSILDSRLPEQPKAIREPVLFSISSKDAVEVFTTKLTRHTQKTIIEAVNASTFPAALHEAYKSLQEDADDNTNKVLG